MAVGMAHLCLREVPVPSLELVDGLESQEKHLVWDVWARRSAAAVVGVLLLCERQGHVWIASTFVFGTQALGLHFSRKMLNCPL